jgi:hypothetical protein
MKPPAPRMPEVPSSSYQLLDNGDSESEPFELHPALVYTPELPDSPDLAPHDESGLAASMSNLRSSSLISDLNELQECTGVLVHWAAGSVWDSYPYMQHSVRSLSWKPIGFNGNNNWLRSQSKQCSIILSADALNSRCCRKCTAIPHSSEYRTFLNRTTDAPDNDEMEESGTGDKSKVSVPAQIMDMEQTTDSHWNWTRCYMRFESGKGKARNAQIKSTKFCLAHSRCVCLPCWIIHCLS